jgi:uncharacterized protein YbjT (DUF2867 family)
MRILVIGGTRFLGPHAVRRLVQWGHDVTIFHRGQTETHLPDDVRHVHGDFGSFADHVDALRRLSPEIVLDMVPFREEDAQRVKAFKGVARRVVVISSGDVHPLSRHLVRQAATDPGQQI